MVLCYSSHEWTEAPTKQARFIYLFIYFNKSSFHSLIQGTPVWWRWGEFQCHCLPTERWQNVHLSWTGAARHECISGGVWAFSPEGDCPTHRHGGRWERCMALVAVSASRETYFLSGETSTQGDRASWCFGGRKFCVLWSNTSFITQPANPQLYHLKSRCYKVIS